MQSVRAQFSGIESEMPHFWWTRGRRCEVVGWGPISPDLGMPLSPVGGAPWLAGADVTKDHDVLICEGDGDKYEPLKDAPSAYLHFAGTVISPRSQEEMCEAAARFVSHYGLPQRDDLFARAYGQPAMPLDTFLSHAVFMSLAVRLLAALKRAEHDGEARPLRKLVEFIWAGRTRIEAAALDATGSMLLESKLWLGGVLADKLSGVRLAPMPDLSAMLDAAMRLRGERKIPLSTIRMVPSFTCNDLLTAMWLQVYLSATEQRLVSIRCRGCGNPFEAKDSRQEYCDRHCRHAANQRSYYRRKKREAHNG